MNEKLRALNRFGLGARIGEAEGLTNPRAWLHDQLDPALVDAPTAKDGALAGLPDLGELAGVLAQLREAQRSRDADALGDARRRIRDTQITETSAALRQRVGTQAPFPERLVAFWTNHLCVSAAAKVQVGVFAGHYERSVIRRHVLGSFEEMVLASAKHPAMLFYLDNFQSVGPGSAVGRRSARGDNPRGLNENYARELLELHTLGVDGGYEQADVEALARILTGWTIAGIGPRAEEGGRGGFVFRPALHEPGEKTVLGRSYGRGVRGGRSVGVEEGEEVMRDLCRHPSTARFVATKLIRHFVSDDPPDEAVSHVARVFQHTDGDLAEVSHALVDLDDAWTTPHGKFRTPQEWVVAVLRAIRVDDVPDRAPGILRQLRHSLWSPPSPKGFEDTQGPWSDPDALMNRAELARSMAGLMRVRDPRVLLDVVDVPPADPLHDALADRSISVRDRLALGIGGPAFQWR